ncbi:MAG: MlaD family protein [Solirubrobacteraceae bacterium]
MSATTSIRAATVAALSVAAIALVIVVETGGSGYTINARFANSGGIVTGGTVDVAGTQVGTIASVSLAPNGEAQVALSIDDPAYKPLHAGTRAAIQALGQAGVDNRFVSLSPGPASAPALPDGAVIPSTATSSLVNFDAILNALDPTTRADLQQLIAHGAQLYAGSGSRYFNRMLAKLDPAMSQLALSTGELSFDRSALRQLVQSTATTATAVASRAPELRAAVANTARTLGAVATERQALAGILTQAPGVLRQGAVTLTELQTSATALTPALRAVPAAAPPLRSFLDALNSTLPRATPVAAQLEAQLKPLASSLRGFQRLAPPTLAALHATTPALKTAMPILAGLREYGPDFLLGVVNGLAGISSGNYDAVGHYVRLEFAQPFQTLFGGFASSLLGKRLASLANNIFKLRTRVTAICPGGNEPPAADGSSPWIPNNAICNPADNIPASVNQP